MSGQTHDPIEFELFKNAIFSVADEMALTIHRTTYSSVLKDNMDYSTAFCDAQGRLVAQGLTLPSHLGSIPAALAAVLRRFGDDMHEGDVFALNDPFEGGMHLPDIFLFRPIFVDGERLAIAATICHHTDVGGRVAGSNASDSTEIYQEGLRIAPMRIYDRGRPNETFFTFVERNVRVPVKVFGDLRAQMAACTIAERAFRDLVGQYGAGKVVAYMAELLDYAERLTRAAIRDLPDGEWRFLDHIDDDGVEPGRPIPLQVTLRKTGDRLVVDWTGSSRQVKGAINNTLSFTRSASYCGIRSILPANIPNNEGYFRAIEVVAPPGTIANAVLPAACAARGLTGFRMVDAMFGVLAMMLPDRVGAAGDGGNTGVSIGGYDAERRPFIYVDFTCCAWGGRPWADGLDGNSHMFANMSSQPIEVTEAEHPIQILSYGFIPDTMGPGRYRGGAPFCREYRFLETEGVLQVRSDRRTFRPFGLYGGLPGKPSMNTLTRDGATEVLPSKFCITIRRGDVFRHEVAGGGGWGDPLERDPAAVLRDVRNGLVSPGAARDDYGVVVDTGRWAVDEPATAALRRELARARGGAPPPAVNRGPAPAAAPEAARAAE
ncbi:hydantoinase B/oxoprolinase family protein [Roseomonas sp. NAR14]|uniref:Hydantoinase B/oxoprolinase family protein n=1 Tax=Roseomonas acroporae TaxID=2937791 RepID=A0A9X2BTJ1_9PROT|nr:hydantoinase B/oxoprolinase family protein [Roseomonas acroporae]MCK8784377.1 hydantoinase B/oxoprolinase family protein [Roseomonas acroporae]